LRNGGFDVVSINISGSILGEVGSKVNRRKVEPTGGMGILGPDTFSSPNANSR